jgi:hypothetical protein
MSVPDNYTVALGMMILSMLCWGSWANTQKLYKNWRAMMVSAFWGVFVWREFAQAPPRVRLLLALMFLFFLLGLARLRLRPSLVSRGSNA